MKQSLIKQKLLQLPRLHKQAIAVVSDVYLSAFACFASICLRLESWQPWTTTQTKMLVVGLLIALPLFTVLGLYRAIFRYAGMQMLFTLSKALAIYSLTYALIFMIIGVEGVPRSVGLIQPIIFAACVVVSRLLVRRMLGSYGHRQKRKGVPKVLIYGAGSAGRQLATGLGQAQEVIVVGYVDDDERLHGQVLNGLPIISAASIGALVTKHGVSQIYLALPSASRYRRNEIIQGLLPHKLLVRTLPGLMELTSGKLVMSDLKELDIEDLLGREPVAPNPILMTKNNTGKVVLITGAGGSIGSELCRQIIKTLPKQLLLVELNEFALYTIEQELSKVIIDQNLKGSSGDSLELISLLGDVRNKDRMSEILQTWKPDSVYHAAAYKHVPLVERNPVEGLRNNVIGTQVLAEQAIAHGVSDFVLISTDKAVRPTNIMGASKRLAEMLLQAMAEQSSQQGHGIRFSMVRFGNVLGSSGSVVPLFRKQIEQGGPITLTDDRITRYFMTIPEAAQLVIQAGAMASGGDVFVLDMGDSVKIIDLARKMIELSGMTLRDDSNQDGDIEIKVTGLRPGEKLYEELLIGDNPMPTAHPRIMKAREDFLPWKDLQAKLIDLNLTLEHNDVPLIRDRLNGLVPGYKPEHDVVDWGYLARQSENDKVII
jgi:FlaA1/EpsC-like NDP-sugar epimerase